MIRTTRIHVKIRDRSVMSRCTADADAVVMSRCTADADAVQVFNEDESFSLSPKVPLPRAVALYWHGPTVCTSNQQGTHQGNPAGKGVFCRVSCSCAAARSNKQG